MMGEDINRVAWKLRADGANWSAVAEELGCAAEAAKLVLDATNATATLPQCRANSRCSIRSYTDA